MQDFRQVIDKDIRLQDDLYSHVNNRWLRENTIPDDEARWSNFNELDKRASHQIRDLVEELLEDTRIKDGSVEQKVRDFYLSGIDSGKAAETGREELNKLLNDIDSTSGKAGLSSLIARLHVKNINVLWQLYVDQDEKDSSRYILRFHQGGLTLPDKDYYDLKSEKMREIKEQLIAHIDKMFKLANSKEPSGQGAEIYDFEKQIASRSRSSTDLRDVEANYNIKSLDQLRELVPVIDWDEYFQELGIEPPQEISIDQPEFFKALDTLIESSGQAVVKSYFKWYSVKGVSALMGEEMARANFEFFGRVLNGIETMRPEWERLISVMNHDIGEALGKLYVARHFPSSAKQRMESMVEDLRSAYAERINNLDWMQPETKEMALDKLSKTRIKVGHPEEFKSYEQLKIKPDSYLSNHWAAQKYESDYQLSKLGKPVDREEWHMSPQTVNAYASFNLCEVVFPAAILQPPFFDEDADDAVNYGGIGAVIGHELTHHFDDQGRMFDGEGNMDNWWGKEDRQEFESRSDLLVKQADEHVVLEGRKLNGKLTLGENIADIGGLAIALQALERALVRNPQKEIEGYTPQQRFFINFARVWRRLSRDELTLQLLISDPHAVEDFRVNNTVRNLEGFYRAFDVNPGDEMYLAPEKRFNVW